MIFKCNTLELDRVYPNSKTNFSYFLKPEPEKTDRSPKPKVEKNPKIET